jgi:penicillin-insensitive murein endopeptidase
MHVIGLTCAALWILVAQVAAAPGSSANADQRALSLGAGRCGKLVGGVALPCSAPLFEAFSGAACVGGRNYLHPLVQQTVVEAYGALAAQHRDRRWQYGEMGKAEGGPLWPHRTHQNGLSADFFFPVVDAVGAPALVPISVLNKYGYGLDFDSRGRLGELSVDWAALADHLVALERAGRGRGVRITRVILAPGLRRTLLREAPAARRFADRFNQRPAWVLHDEHYHVDFSIPAPLRRPLRCRSPARVSISKGGQG